MPKLATLDETGKVPADQLPAGVGGVPGPQGDPGPTGPAGADSIVPGPPGIQGPQGEPGTGVTLKGSVATHAALPGSGNTIGDLWLVEEDGDYHVWDGLAWQDAGHIVGPEGPQGIPGTNGTDGATGPPGTTDYNALSNKPTLGTAAAKDIGFFDAAGAATAAAAASLPLHGKADTAGLADSATGNAGTATKLAATKTINGIPFDGSANILVPYSNRSKGVSVITGTAARTLGAADLVAGNIQQLTGTTARTFTLDTGANITTAFTLCSVLRQWETFSSSWYPMQLQRQLLLLVEQGQQWLTW